MTIIDDFKSSISVAIVEWAQKIVDAAELLVSLPENGGEEFVGPFPSWKDLKRDYGAVGDGVADDTAAVKAALGELVVSGASPNLFVPAGTYLISDSAVLLGALGVGIIGEDPVATVFKYTGPDGGIALHLDGCAYGRIGRITFDGGGKNGVLVEQSAQSAPGRQFGTGNEYADLVFQNAAIGISAGKFDIGEAESSVLRCSFKGLQNGILLRNFNCLDWFTWDCLFDGCKTGISNTLIDKGATGAGAFHAYGHVFKNSSFADLEVGNTGNFNFRDCYSVGSNAFIYEVFYYTNAAPTRIDNCTVIPGDASVPDGPIWQGNGGPLIITDSYITSPPTRPAVTVVSSNGGDCLSVGNCYSVDLPVRADRLIVVDDHQWAAPAMPTLPATPRNMGRQVFEVPITDDGTFLQAAIAQAAALNGQRPIVHIPFGRLALRQQIIIPPCDVQIVGDGWNTRIDCQTSIDVAFTLQGPSKATFRDFYIVNARMSGISIKSVGQGRVYMMQPLITGATAAGMLVDNVNGALVEMHDCSITNSAIAVDVQGGTSRTHLFAGTADGNGINYNVRDGVLVVRDTWHDAPASVGNDNFAVISGASTVTIEGSVDNMPTAGRVAIDIKDLTGIVTVLGMTLEGSVNVTNSPNGKVWVAGSNFIEAKANQQTIPGAVASLNRLYRLPDGSSIIDSEIPTDEFIRSVLAQSRNTRPSIIGDLPAGVTDARFYRVTIEKCPTGIHIQS